MSHSLSKLLIVAGAAVVAAGVVAKPTVSHAQPAVVLTFVDPGGVVEGGPVRRSKAKRPSAKARAQATAAPRRGGAYMMGGMPPGYGQAPITHDLKQWCPQCTWVTPGSYASPGK